MIFERKKNIWGLQPASASYVYGLMGKIKDIKF